MSLIGFVLIWNWTLLQTFNVFMLPKSVYVLLNIDHNDFIILILVYILTTVFHLVFEKKKYVALTVDPMFVTVLLVSLIMSTETTVLNKLILKLALDKFTYIYIYIVP